MKPFCPSMECVASGTASQAAHKFKGSGRQCVAMGAFASVYSVVYNKREIMETHDIDHILTKGDDLFMSLKHLIPSNEIYLCPDDLPEQIELNNQAVHIESVANNWLDNGLYPDHEINKESRYKDLENKLKFNVFNLNYNDMTDSILFTGQLYTISFWRFNNNYYLFNSHGVNTSNEQDSNGVARLFKCNNLKTLVKLLFRGTKLDGTQYAMNKIRVIDYPTTFQNNATVQDIFSQTDAHTPIAIASQELQSTRSTDLTNATTLSSQNSIPILRGLKSKSNTNFASQESQSILNNFETVTSIDHCLPLSVHTIVSQNSISILDEFEFLESPAKKFKKQFANIPKEHEQKLFKMEPIVIIENLPLHNSFSLLSLDEECTSKKKGRPKKIKRGRPKTKLNAHLDAVKKYTQKNKQINQQSVKKYTKKNPEVNREAVKKYTSKNPEVNREAVKKYTSKNPEVNREAVKTYTSKNPEVNQKAVTEYNLHNRNIEAPLRRSANLIGEKRGNELECIQLFTLKNPSLFSPNTFRCSNCKCRLFDEEKLRKQWCCGQGAYNVQNFSPLNEDFYEHPDYLEHPRAYNNLFAFSALGVSHGQVEEPEGFSFLKIQGRIYHRVFDLSYTGSINNIGLYINDSNERERIATKQNLDKQVVRSITNFLHNVNPYIDCFKRLSQEQSEQAFIKFQKTSRATDGNILGDLPIGREIAALLCTDTEQFTPHCIAIWKVGNKKPHTVDIMHPLYESFQYPLLYPEGNPGWYPNKLDNKNKKLTQNKYVRCLILSEERFSELGTLAEEWMVDMYCRITEERLRFINSLQKSNTDNALRSAPLSEVQMSVETANQIRQDETVQGEGLRAGRIYLPCTFTGGPRYMQQKYMDAMALVNRAGKPSYFLTFTCNRKWPEIQQSIKNRKANPAIIARVFQLKLQELLKDIRSGLWFGPCDYIMHVIEFQKRGLPHAHICFRVRGGGPADNIDIDKMIRADIPSETECDGQLRKTVLNHMIHGPCCPPYRTNLPCWDREKKKCLKHFPEPETPTTYKDEKGFIHYRRDSKNKATIRYYNQEIPIDDTWVVPYNAALLLKYNAHINITVTTQSAVIKYLFKYMTKGPDESRVAIVQDLNNEIEQYVTKRYLSSSDACWRIFEFDVTAREPNVKMLSVHVEGQQNVYFKDGDEQKAIDRTHSDLLTYFNRPIGEEFDQLTYQDFHERYIVHSSRPSTKNVQIHELSNGMFITKRQRGELVTRLFWLTPVHGERFYFRLLLKNKPGRSFDDFKRLGGPTCETYQDAAKALGLASDEKEYELAMEEASCYFVGRRLRSLFVLLAINGALAASLWEIFKDNLSEDMMSRASNDRERAHNLCLIEINRMLLKHGSSLEQHGLPSVIDNSTELGRELFEYNCNNLEQYVQEWLPMLSPDQQIVFDYILNLCTDNNFREQHSTAIFIDGPAGTGKTLLLNVIAARIRGSLKEVVLCTASSAIAAQNYEGGTTAHSMFKFPLELVDDLGFWTITNGSQRAELIYHAKIIIYDEAPMAHKYLIHMLDRSLRDLMKSDKIFGGKIIIFSGDFRQLPPVVQNAKSNSDILNSSVKSSPLWKKLKTFTLFTSQRCKNNEEYAKYLLELGSNQLPLNTVIINENNVQKLIELKSIQIVTELDDLIDFVFPHVVIDEPDVCANRAILCTRNDASNEINSDILNRLPGETVHLYSYDKPLDDNDANEFFLQVDALNRIQAKNIPDHDLSIKIGCVCMIIRNLSFTDGLINGTKVIIVKASPRLITARKPGGIEEFFIPRIQFKTPIAPKSPYEMIRHQFPLRVSYAMTIHKSQGQTISRVGVDLRSDIFSHGQLYVALGRVRDVSNIKVLLHKDRIINNKAHANNVIIKELL